MAHEKTLARREQGEIEQIEPWNTFREMERMFRSLLSPFPMVRSPRWMQEFTAEYMPDVDLKETDNEFILSAVIPGMDKNDIDINVSHDRITICGERKSEEIKPEERYHLRQQSYGSFRVSYNLPSDVKSDDVKATYKKGILEVKMPKAEMTHAHKVDVEVQD